MAGNGGETYDITSLLSGNDRDYVVRNNGDQVKIADLKDKTVGLYFSAHWCPPCRGFTPKLAETYQNLTSQSKPLEVIFISHDEDEESFTSYFSEMPWLAVPFSDSEARERLDKTFKIRGIPSLVMIDANGNLLTEKAVGFVREHMSDAYPFTPERFAELKEIAEAEKRNQTIRSILVRGERDYVFSSKGDKVPVSELEGKYVGLYFNDSRSGEWEEFTPILTQIHEKLKQNNENFEIVTVLLDDEESSFNDTLTKLPFYVIPFEDKSIEKLIRYFELRSLPTLVMIGSDGKTLRNNCADIIEEHGVDAWEGFPFSQEKMGILEEKAKAKLEQQTLESLLVRGEFNYVVRKDGTKIPVSDLVGKTIILYFSADWCGPCHAFLPKLIEEYNKIKSKHPDSFEIVFVSSDRDEDSYNDFYSSMPWLALPLDDPRKSFLKKTFKIRGIPSLIAIGPNGKTVSKDVRMLLTEHGAHAYPFTEERIKELQVEIENMAKGWPEKIKHELHESHELVLTKCGPYCCDGCDEMGGNWSYKCRECDFDLHPKCALEKADGEDMGEEDGKNAAQEGYVCEGDVCRKVE
ncbi:Nucleoredoxin [Rhynchospora pubera]|uniref:protein-disulfide reductase n=1 Tax=Rhynchospora pubera TaxID=906938 RepID=A0AAV8CM75_9POAL|nr:Nucleoredoxin [Rhynchospora pubera]